MITQLIARSPETSRSVTLEPISNRKNTDQHFHLHTNRNNSTPTSSGQMPYTTARRVEMYPGTVRQSSFIARLTEFVEANMDDETYDISRLCRDIGASRTQIHNKVKKWTGLSTTKFIWTIKMRKAKELLCYTDLNITQVAYELGFRDHRYFSRIFNECFGLSPRAYRKRELQNW